MSRRYCAACRMDDGTHVGGCPETPGSSEDRWAETEVIPDECHEGGKITCAHREHRLTTRHNH